MMRYVPDGVLLLPFMLTQDEATVDGNARKTLHPVYATLGIVRAADRNQAWARFLLGYLPKANKNSKPAGMATAAWTRYTRVQFQAAMSAMLGPIRRYMSTGVRMQVCGEFQWRPTGSCRSALFAMPCGINCAQPHATAGAWSGRRAAQDDSRTCDCIRQL